MLTDIERMNISAISGSGFEMNTDVQIVLPFVYKYCYVDELFNLCQAIDLGMSFTNDIKYKLFCDTINKSLRKGWSAMDDLNIIIDFLNNIPTDFLNDIPTESARKRIASRITQLVLCAAHSLFWIGSFRMFIPNGILLKGYGPREVYSTTLFGSIVRNHRNI